MLQSLCGLIVIPLIAWLLSERRDALAMGHAVKFAAGGIALQFIIAGLFILIPQLSFVFELLAYLQLADTSATVLSDRSRLILTYALCGFANFGSLGIMTGGLLALCPDRRADILSLGPRSLVSGLLATLMTGAVIGAMTPP